MSIGVSADLVFTADVSSLDATIARLEAMQEIVVKYAALIVAEIKRLAPYDDRPNRPAGPHLRDSVTAHLSVLAAEITAGEGLPDARAIFMEYGTAKVAAHPYFRVAFERYAAAFFAEVNALFGG